MLFKVRFGDISKEFTKKMVSVEESSDRPVKLYYEEESKILVFFKNRGVLFYSELVKDDSFDLVSFNLEYLTDAIELLENPIKDRMLITRI